MAIFDNVFKYLTNMTGETVKRMPSDILSLLAVHGGGVYKSSKATSPANGEIQTSGIIDNALWTILLSKTANHISLPNGLDVNSKIRDLIEFLWNQVTPADKKAVLKKIQDSINIGASYIATFNAESEARQLLSIPLIAVFSEVYALDQIQAPLALINFCSQPIVEMARIYETFVAQPERGMDKAMRFGHNLLDNMRNADKKIAKRIEKKNNNLLKIKKKFKRLAQQ